MKKRNRFDNLIINVPKIFKKSTQHTLNYRNIFIMFYQLNLLPLVFRKYLWYLLKRLNLDTGWFYEFKYYWEKYLGGIVLWGVEDFYFLRGVYRQKFHRLALASNTSNKTHLLTWQKPEVLYFLLDMVYRKSLYNELAIVSLYFKYRQERDLPILEFGCGTAPITQTLIEFFGLQNQKIYISDIQILAFHYAAYKFQRFKNVIPILLDLKDNFSPKCPEKLGAIFCMTVFEHMNDPLNVAKKFYDLLAQGGLLIFDYLKTKGEGMDSIKAVKGRDKTLKYITDNFKIIKGNIWSEDGNEKIVAAKI